MEEKQTYNPTLVAIATVVVSGALGWTGITLSSSYAFGTLGMLIMFASIFPVIWIPIHFSDKPGLTYFIAVMLMVVISILIGI